MKTTFVLKDKKSNTETLIYLIVRIREDRIKISTKETILPKFWNKKANRAKETRQFAEHPEFNTRLDKIQSSVKTIYRRYLNDNNNIEPSLDLLKGLIISSLRPTTITPNEIKNDLISYSEFFVKEAKERINPKTKRMISPTTISVYNRCIELLKEYCKKSGIRSNFDVIDLNFCLRFKDFLIEKDLAQNTVAKHIKTFKTFMNEATSDGVNKRLDFKSRKFIADTEDVEDIYLNENELDEIYNLDLSEQPHLDMVRDLFIIGCWTGLRYSDYSQLTPENIKGEYIEIKETKKTKKPVTIPLHWTAKKIILKYKKNGKLDFPPAYSNPKMNLYIKDIGELVPSLHTEVNSSITRKGIRITTPMKKCQRIKTHSARRSFATNLYLDGLPTSTIMAITGHRSEAAFFKYIKITPNENAKIVKEHFDRKQRLKAKKKKLLKKERNET